MTASDPDIAQALDLLSAHERDTFATRAAIFLPDAREAFDLLWGEAGADWLGTCAVIAARAFHARSPGLKRRDLARLHVPDWFQHPDMLGYSTYVDRFGGDFDGVCARLDYLAELGVTYLHLLPVTTPRAGENDGGYAVESFSRFDPRLGGDDGFARLSAACAARGLALGTDLVLNHTADSHDWARRARAGDATCRAYYIRLSDRAEVERYEATLPEVFPVDAPGNFTHVDEMDGWVWTSFYPYQWDLNYRNPAVFAEMLAIMLNMANRGIDILRLDSVAFLGKRRGTDCRNLPEAHALLRAFRAFTRLAAPGLALKGEAIVTPEHLTVYLGEGRHAGNECQLAYHNTLMVLLWSALAEGDATRLTRMLRRMPAPPSNAAWITYIRCHDDIGWAVLEADDHPEDGDPGSGARHAAWLSEFYAGRIAGSFARGATFQADPGDPAHGTVGMLSALAGLAAARETGDAAALDRAIARIRLLHGVILAFSGLPLLYMGDEIGLGNAAMPGTGEETDGRALHRPRMDWAAAARRHDPAAVEGRIFSDLQALIACRARTPALHADTPARALEGENPHVFMLRRSGARGRILMLANTSDSPQALSAEAVMQARFRFPLRDRLSGRRFTGDAPLTLAGYDLLWLEEIDQ